MERLSLYANLYLSFMSVFLLAAMIGMGWIISMWFWVLVPPATIICLAIIELWKLP